MRKLTYRFGKWAIEVFHCVAVAAMFIVAATASIAAPAAEDVSGNISSSAAERAGMSPEVLQKVDDFLQDIVDQEIYAGIVAMIGRQNQVVYEAYFGMADIEAGIPMQPDTLFRIQHFTIPVVAAGAMILYDEDRFNLDDPVANYLPEYADMEVMVPSDDGGYSTVPANSPITIRQLMSFMSGITDAYNHPELSVSFQEAGLKYGIVPLEGTLADVSRRLASLPLAANPGESFVMGMAFVPVGRLIEVISGMSLDEFLKKRLFEPSGMKDTYGFLPTSELPRLANIYGVGPTEPLVKYDQEPFAVGGTFLMSPYAQFSEQNSYFDPMAQLISTAADFGRFCRMMLNRGELDGVRIHEVETVEIMTTNHIPDDVFPWSDYDNFGLGVGIRVWNHPEDRVESIGSYGWGCYVTEGFHIDPAEDMWMVLLSQRPEPVPDPNPRYVLRAIAYEAIID